MGSSDPQYIAVVKAASTDELLHKLANIDISAPRRMQGDRKCALERRSICMLLATLASESLLEYPLLCEHGDKPDTRLTLPLGQIGVEITETIAQDDAWVDAHAEREGYAGFRHLPSYRPGEKQRSREEINRIARGDPTSYPSMRTKDEIYWAEAIDLCCAKKCKDFQNPGFKKYGHNWLLIVDDWYPPAIHVDLAYAKLSERLKKRKEMIPFDLVFVERLKRVGRPQDVLQFNGHEMVSHQVNDLWSQLR